MVVLIGISNSFQLIIFSSFLGTPNKLILSLFILYASFILTFPIISKLLIFSTLFLTKGIKTPIFSGFVPCISNSSISWFSNSISLGIANKLRPIPCIFKEFQQGFTKSIS